MRSFLKWAFLINAVLTISACAGQATMRDGGAGSVIPAVLQGGGQPTNFTRFSPNTYSGFYGGIVSGPDGNMWFLDQGGPGIAKITMTGAVTEFPLPNSTPFLTPQYITLGPHKTFFVLSTCFNGNTGGSIDFVTIAGVAKSFMLPATNSCYGGIAAGADGNAWVTGPTDIYRISPSGVIQPFPYPENTQINPGPIVAGPGGLLWFGDNTSDSLGSIDPATGAITEYPYGQSCFMEGLAAPPDGNLWFSCFTGTTSDIIRMTPTGVSTAFPVSNPNIVPSFATVGPGGFPYFTVSFNQGTPPGLLKVNTASGAITFIAAPYGFDNFVGDAAGPDGNVWISAFSGIYTGHIDVYILNILGVKPTSLNFSAPQLTAALSAHETKRPTLTALSSNVGIATVAPGQNLNTFVVTSVGVGYCTITISDSKGNSFDVPVTVQ